MKAQILKIAGVKSEKEFYKKFPTEESFMKVHGKALKKAQIGAMIQGSIAPQFNPQPINFQQLYDQNDMFITGSTQDMRKQEAMDLANLEVQQKMANKKSGLVDSLTQLGNALGSASKEDGAKNGKKLKKAITGKEIVGGINKGIGKAGGPAAVAQNIGNIVGGIQQMRDEKNIMKEAQQMAGVSDVALQASMTRPEQVQKKYVRPEDNINTGSEFFPIYGVGTVISRNGTEIANTFAPNTIYTDLEEAKNGISTASNGGGFFSNLGDPNFLQKNKTTGEKTFISKFQEQGGGDALSQLTSRIGNPKGYGPSGASRVGGGIGSVAGTIIGGPVGGMIGKFAGEKIGDLVDRKAEKTEQARGVIDRNITSMAFNQGVQGLQQQNYSYVRDGGMINPQVATSLEGIPLTRLFAPDPTMDTLRAGGHLKSYTPPSERAMYTGRDKFAMGGDLETHWGGYAEPMSYNPYLPNGGETVMFRGKSHDESDGRGNTGIGITYGDSPVEVERGEPAVQLRNGTDGDSSLTVYGNLQIPSFGASLIGDDKAKGKKFKNYVAELSKTEQKQNKIVEKSTEKLDNLEVITPQDLLSFESYKANILGANMKLKDIAKKKQDLASLQAAINDTAEEYNLVADDLAKGKVKQAKKGASIAKAQLGGTYEDISDKIYRDALALEPLFIEEVDPSMNLDEVAVSASKLPPTIQELRNRKLTPGNYPQYIYANTPVQKTEAEDGKIDWMTLLNQVIPYLRPSNAQPLDPRQLAGEMLALATNQVEPVQVQTIQPQLNVPFDISLQEIINENEADYRAAQRLFGYNPAALAALNAQKYQANQKVLGEQFKLNQAIKDKVYAENRNLLNQANLNNLQAFDQQYSRQQEALSNTKATSQAALSSIASKYMQNQLENRTLQTFENLYNYRFDPRFRAMNMNTLAIFDTMIDDLTPAQQKALSEKLALASAKATGASSTTTNTTTIRNGGIVRATK